VHTTDSSRYVELGGVSMKGTKRNNKGAATAGLRVPLSEVEEAFFKLFTVERLSLRLAAHRRGCGVRNARQYRKRLIEKGWMDSHYNPIPIGMCSPAYGGVNWTLHGLEYVVDIIAGQNDEPYRRALEKHQGEMPCRGSTVMLFPKKLHQGRAGFRERQSEYLCVESERLCVHASAYP
jgi:hypothetical protein